VKVVVADLDGVVEEVRPSDPTAGTTTGLARGTPGRSTGSRRRSLLLQWRAAERYAARSLLVEAVPITDRARLVGDDLPGITIVLPTIVAAG
jgi:hypothetical protein